jgi:hypothetical protein
VRKKCLTFWDSSPHLYNLTCITKKYSAARISQRGIRAHIGYATRSGLAWGGDAMCVLHRPAFYPKKCQASKISTVAKAAISDGQHVTSVDMLSELQSQEIFRGNLSLHLKFLRSFHVCYYSRINDVQL